jgi:hypothetical protein
MVLRPRAMPTFQFQRLNPAFQSDPRRILGQQLMGQGASTAPVRTPLQGLGRLSSALVGAYLQRNALDAQAQREAQATEALMSALPQNLSPQLTQIAQANPAAFESALITNLMQPQTTSEIVDQNGLKAIQTTTTNPITQQTTTQLSNPVQLRPAKDTRTAAERNAAALGLVPGTQEFNEYIREVSVRKPDTTAVNVDTGRQFTPEEKKVGESRATRIDKTYFEPAAKARNNHQH